jgi:DNA oxidative demethylase
MAHSSHPLWSSDEDPIEASTEQLIPGFTLLRGYCAAEAPTLFQFIKAIAASAPFRQMIVPGGHTMSVAMTNTGELGWVADRSGYHYLREDPLTRKPWPPMPESFQQLARSAAAAGGFENFSPNGCLINRYSPGAKLSLHQDKDEQDFTQPIVSVSLGLPAVFLLGTQSRSDTPRRIRLEHGDIAVWGGPARLIFHGVAPLAPGTHPLAGAHRINLTFRRIAEGQPPAKKRAARSQ